MFARKWQLSPQVSWAERHCLEQNGTFRACSRLEQNGTFRACSRLEQIGTYRACSRLEQIGT